MPRSVNPPLFDNNPLRESKRAKVEIRRRVAAAINGPVHVFDAFAGAGGLYRDAWRSLAASYVGCDLRYFRDGRKVFVADNRRVLRALDLAPFNVFDLDAYGAPWEQAVIIAAKRKLAPGERVGIIVTDNGLLYKNSNISHAVTDLIGLHRLKIPGSALFQDRADIHAKIWNEIARRMFGRIEHFWQAEPKKKFVAIYQGVVLVGVLEAERVIRAPRTSPAAMVPDAGLELRSLDELVAPMKEVGSDDKSRNVDLRKTS
jgi:hypothetical protein